MIQELTRILGDRGTAEAPGGILLLPLVGEADALAFLRSVPAGTSWERLSELASAWRAARPVIADDSEGPDHESAV